MRAIGGVVTLLLVLGSATIGLAEDGRDRDPWERFNRAMFSFNDALDRWVLEPVAKGYDKVMPDPLEECVGNFFHNLRVPINGVNDLLQGKPVDGASDVGRFAVNTTIGLAGFLDPATYFGLVRHDEDFGQTLGVWGLDTGPYLVIPLFGASTVRDAGGLAVDAALTPTWYFVDAVYTVGSRAVETVNTRARYLEEVKRAREASFDFYSFVRNAYLQRRDAMVRDTAEPRESDDSIYYPEEPAPAR